MKCFDFFHLKISSELIEKKQTITLHYSRQSRHNQSFFRGNNVAKKLIHCCVAGKTITLFAFCCTFVTYNRVHTGFANHIDKVQKMFLTELEFRRPDFQLIRNRLKKRTPVLISQLALDQPGQSSGEIPMPYDIIFWTLSIGEMKCSM